MLVFRRSLRVLGLAVVSTAMALSVSMAATETTRTESASVAVKSGPAVKVVVIPVRDEIAKPVLYILRRGLKQAIKMKADVVVLDMKTPGGALDVTFEIMEVLGEFPGKTITFVNTEAISAGAFISATTGDIWFSPAGVIGAAAPVLATGGEIDASMKQKIVSYLRARVRAISEGKPYRGEVISAMIDADFELKIGDKVIKPKGELLSLTAKEASASYGDPPQPLLAAGIAENLEDLLYTKLGATPESTIQLSITGAEKTAVLLNSVRTILLGLGLLAAFIEFKTPGFGVFGISAAILLAAVFFGHYIAGFSGHEPVLVFLLGVAAVVVELVFFPGVVFLALTGIVLMLGSLVWSMADIWPNQPLELSGDLLLLPVANVGAGLLIAILLAVLLARFMPRGWIWDRMVLTANVGQGRPSSQGSVSTGEAADKLMGAKGVAVTGLYPSGQVEVDGRRYEAHLALGSADPGARVIVTGRAGFSILVEKLDA